MTIKELRVATNYQGWYPSGLKAHEHYTFYVKFDLGDGVFARITYYKKYNSFITSVNSYDYVDANIEEVKKFIKRYTKLAVFA